MTKLAPAPSGKTKLIVWSVAGLGLLVMGGGLALLAAVVLAFDTDRDLTDFASPAEARSFTSAHLPVPLPAGARVEALHYDRWTDWRLTAQVRLSTAGAVDEYLAATRAQRVTNDEYCSAAEPAGGARYFLPEVSACGTIARIASQQLEISCHTR